MSTLFSGITVNVASELLTETCVAPGCGILYAVPADFVKARRRDHALFYCPNGHNQYYPGETAEEKQIKTLEAEKEGLQRRLTAAREDLSVEQQAREQSQRRHAATKGLLTKTKNRIANGLCPCCNRTFVNLGRHMKGQHPEYTTPAEGAE